MSNIVTTLHEFKPSLQDWLFDLNQANVPEVSSLTKDELNSLIKIQYAIRIAYQDQVPAGAIFLMRPGQNYASANYRWFCETGEDFLYVDRVMIGANHRGQGLGRVLYEAAETLARNCQAPRITCEINTLPPNPGSFAFHEKLGFRGLLERPSDSGKRVMMMEKRLLTNAD